MSLKISWVVISLKDFLSLCAFYTPSTLWYLVLQRNDNFSPLNSKPSDAEWKKHTLFVFCRIVNCHSICYRKILSRSKYYTVTCATPAFYYYYYYCCKGKRKINCVQLICSPYIYFLCFHFFFSSVPSILAEWREECEQKSRVHTKFNWASIVGKHQLLSKQEDGEQSIEKPHKKHREEIKTTNEDTPEQKVVWQPKRNWSDIRRFVDESSYP